MADPVLQDVADEHLVSLLVLRHLGQHEGEGELLVLCLVVRPCPPGVDELDAGGDEVVRDGLPEDLVVLGSDDVIDRLHQAVGAVLRGGQSEAIVGRHAGEHKKQKELYSLLVFVF